MSNREKTKIIFTIALLALSLVAANAFCVDPMYIGVGARPLGMGKAYVAVAEDADTIFMNPAGLAGIKKIKFSSMYTTLLDDIQYMVVGGVYPLDGDGSEGVLGGGLIRSSVADIPLYDNTATPIGTSAYGSNVMFVSYGVDLGKLKNYGDISTTFKDVSVGGTFKYIANGASNISGELDGSGFDADLGVLYKYSPSIQFGANLQNFMGPSMSYSSGAVDDIPGILKVGTKINIMGDKEKGKALYGADYVLNGAADYDISLSEGVPGILHMGLEYKPMEMLTIRAGIDQNPAPGGAQNNMTLGLGLDYEGVQFNYAYHPYGEIPGTTTHFFSICYVGKEEIIKVAEPEKPIITLISPNDKTITQDHIVKIEGTVRPDAGVTSVQIDTDVVPVSAGRFETVIPLTFGKNLIEVRATTPAGNSEMVSARLIRVAKFKDVQADHWAKEQIENSATVGLVEGYPDGTFLPERALSRAELSTLLVKAKGQLPTPPQKSVFKDLKKMHWASTYVKGAVELGYVKGYPDGTFRPNNKINRAEGVMVYGRFDELKEAEKLELSPYADLAANFWASKMITSAKQEGLLEYLGDNDFLPTKQLSRAEAVEILSKSKIGRAKIDDLHNWEIGFVPGGNSKDVTMKTFGDVANSYWAVKPIQYLATSGIIGGYPDGSFKPEKALTRAELCTLLVKAKGAAAPTRFVTTFTDLPAKHWASSYVKTAVDIGLVTGYPDGRFQPNKKLSRSESVAIIARFDRLETTEEAKFGSFPDMTARHWAAKYIKAAKEAGILDYLKGQDFQPDRSLTRAEAAEMIAKTKFGTMKIKEVFGRNVDLSIGASTGGEKVQ